MENISQFGCEELSFAAQQEIEGGALLSSLKAFLTDLLTNSQVIVATVPVVGTTAFSLTAPLLAAVKNAL
ncbi:hypothetical protein LX64_04255 [Chitinophaga skermanii]|uniref:Uncharacterized protein n=1 Tax=Chitinophaga skermanii TaxID=331697 RepID=A0A327Q5Y3_9BACT|nr:hypothetical protein [Chitinophaga skermanii]RAI99710.1 hypothetical protein LX64_04255 [Chitinophaga skermanii]